MTSSVAALELFASNPDRFDLVVTDMAMPEMAAAPPAPEMQGQAVETAPPMPQFQAMPTPVYQTWGGVPYGGGWGYPYNGGWGNNGWGNSWMPWGNGWGGNDWNDGYGSGYGNTWGNTYGDGAGDGRLNLIDLLDDRRTPLDRLGSKGRIAAKDAWMICRSSATTAGCSAA